MARLRVGLEEGKTWTFATAVDWPGWSRRGKGTDAAIEELEAYRGRYEKAVGVKVGDKNPDVIGRVPSGMGADFGAPMEVGPWDHEPPDAEKAVGLLRSCWEYFDVVVARSPLELKKGPRGGGRDRDKMVHHVREAERSYAPKVGVRVPIRTPWPEQRDMIASALLDAKVARPWPVRYGLQRVAWHVLDHAWEIEDKQP